MVKVERPNLSFVVVVSNDKGKQLNAYVLDQFVPPPGGEATQRRIRNQVEAHLFHQFRRTGHHHAVVFEGSHDAAVMIVNDVVNQVV